MIPVWPPRDWRMFVALFFLGGGGVAMTVFAWRLASLTAEHSTGPWPLAYALYGALGLIGVVLTGFSYVLGKRNFSFKAGAVSGETSGGQDDAAPAATVTATIETKVAS
jgi:hypothetical protein